MEARPSGTLQWLSVSVSLPPTPSPAGNPWSNWEARGAKKTQSPEGTHQLDHKKKSKDALLSKSVFKHLRVALCLAYNRRTTPLTLINWLNEWTCRFHWPLRLFPALQHNRFYVVSYQSDYYLNFYWICQVAETYSPKCLTKFVHSCKDRG